MAASLPHPAHLLQALSNTLTTLARNGVNAFNNAAELRLCSAPKLVTGDYEDAVEEVLHDEEEGRQHRLVAAASGGDFECCQPVVDSNTWIAVIGGMAVVAFFLRNTIITVLGRKRRRRAAGGGLLLQGRITSMQPPQLRRA